LPKTNQNPKPFTWTAESDAIIDKVSGISAYETEGAG
jgi:hypothetical protein